MTILSYIMEAWKSVPGYMRSSRVTMLFFLGIAAVFCIFIAIHTRWSLKGVRSAPARLLILLVLLIQWTMILTVCILFTVASEISELDPARYGGDFYKEMCVFVLIFLAVYAFLLWRNASRGTDESVMECLKKMGKAVAVGLVSLLFWRTGAEAALTGWGPVLWQKTLGAWIFSGYTAWASMLIFTLAQLPFSILIVLLVGDPEKALEDAIDDVIDR